MLACVSRGEKILKDSYRKKSLKTFNNFFDDIREVAQLCLTLQLHGLYSPWNSPGQNTGVGSLSLLQGIFPTQGLNPGLLHCRQILYQMNYTEILFDLFSLTFSLSERITEIVLLRTFVV